MFLLHTKTSKKREFTVFLNFHGELYIPVLPIDITVK